mgnify:CR=1 FL=1
MVLIEDDDGIRELLMMRLKREGHKVVAEASTREQALKIAASLIAGEVIADVVVVDGNLSKGRNDCAEGAEIVQRLRENIDRLGPIAIYGMSGMGEVIGVDENIPKGNGRKLLKLISELPQSRHTEAA